MPEMDNWAHTPKKIEVVHMLKWNFSEFLPGRLFGEDGWLPFAHSEH
jgi:hypothetical protein